jgi:putative flippase GtrA
VKQVAQFALSGVIGYLVDAGVLVLLAPEFGAYVGRLISFLAAVATTWLINRSLTFRHQRKNGPLHREFALYAATALGGGAVNLACYSILVYAFQPPVPFLPLAVAVGSLAGMAANFWLSRRFVFNADRRMHADSPTERP